MGSLNSIESNDEKYQRISKGEDHCNFDIIWCFYLHGVLLFTSRDERKTSNINNFSIPVRVNTTIH